MLFSNISEHNNTVTATAVLKDTLIRETRDLGTHGNLHVYLHISNSNAIAQVELEMDKRQAFGFANEVLESFETSGAVFDPNSLTYSELVHLIACMRARS